MSTEEIINAWKNNEDEAEKQPNGNEIPNGEKLSKDQRKLGVPSNPAGEQELSDDDLEAAEGGKSISCVAWSC